MLSRDLIDVSRARSAADAAALAVASRADVRGRNRVGSEQRGDARELVDQVGAEVVVEVRVGDAVASARATE